MGASTVSEGFDLMFTDMGEHFIVEIGTNRGRKPPGGTCKAETSHHGRCPGEGKDTFPDLSHM